MNKKKALTPEERVKKYGNNIVGIGVLGILFCLLPLYSIFSNIFRFSKIINNYTDIFMKDYINQFIISGVGIALFIAMIIGIKKRKKFGLVIAWIFECCLGLFLLYNLMELIFVPDGFMLALVFMGGITFGGFVIEVIITIGFLIVLMKYSQALTELNSENQEHVITDTQD